ncbi:MAG TPA: hypothetical protein DCL41_08670 [Bdellovibrionales bacterium]|nr:hypothetical protein [Thioclava sp.]HAG91931.1 hypothetical protein [Bdellovibrionales bacterium]
MDFQLRNPVVYNRGVRRIFFTPFDFVQKLLQSPIKVLWICLALAFANLILDGSLYRYYVLSNDLKETRIKIERVRSENQNLQAKLDAMKDPRHLERVARDRFDLVKKDELIFVFSEDQPTQN